MSQKNRAKIEQKLSKIGVRKLKGHTWCYDQGVALRPPACAARPPRPRARAARPPRPRGPPHAPSSRASRPRRPCNERRRADSTRDSRAGGRWPRARATLEPAENLMPPGCAPRPFVYFPSLTTWCGQAGLHSCDAARADGGWSARPARRRGRPQHEGPAQAAHAAEGEEEVVALSKFMCARHACGAAGRRPPCSARSAQLPKPCKQVP